MRLIKIIFVGLIVIFPIRSEQDVFNLKYVNNGNIHKELDSHISNRINKFFSRLHKAGRFNGSILFADNDKIFNKNYGYTSFRTKKHIDDNTVFKLASVTKPFTSTAIMMLINRGQLSYKDNVRKYIKNFPYNDVTIKSLLTHRSGLNNYMYFVEEYNNNKDKNIYFDNDSLMKFIVKHNPFKYFSADNGYFYSNTNYAILSLIIERVSKKSYSDFMKDNIFNPLGMNNTFVYNQKTLSPDAKMSIGYNHRRVPYENYYLDNIVGDKGICSNVLDLFKFELSLRNNILLPKYFLDNAYKSKSKGKNYGYGWRITHVNNKKIIYHKGWWRGYRSYFIRSIEDNKTIIITTNKIERKFISVKKLVNLMY